MPRPKLILSSFRGFSGGRIQTYSLKVPSPKARAILVHGSRSHFQAEFMSYNHTLLLSDNNFSENNNKLRITKLTYKYGEDLLSAEELKSLVTGQLELEEGTTDIYKDGTDGWATTNIHVYEESFVEVLNNNDISVYGLDLQSYGRSEAPSGFLVGKVRGLVEDFDVLCQDVITYLKSIKADTEDSTPIYLVGMSMGGGIVARTAELLGEKTTGNDPLVEGVVLLAPMLGIITEDKDFFVNKLWYLHSLASKVLPTLTVVESETIDLSDADTLLRQKDRLILNSTIPYRTVFNMCKIVEDIFNDYTKVNPKCSVLAFHCKSDDLCMFESTEKFCNLLTQVEKKKLVPLDKIGHIITAPPCGLQVAQYISDWVLKGSSDHKLDWSAGGTPAPLLSGI